MENKDFEYDDVLELDKKLAIYTSWLFKSGYQTTIIASEFFFEKLAYLSDTFIDTEKGYKGFNIEIDNDIDMNNYILTAKKE